MRIFEDFIFGLSELLYLYSSSASAMFEVELRRLIFRSNFDQNYPEIFVSDFDRVVGTSLRRGFNAEYDNEVRVAIPKSVLRL